LPFGNVDFRTTKNEKNMKQERINSILSNTLLQILLIFSLVVLPATAYSTVLQSAQEDGIGFYRKRAGSENGEANDTENGIGVYRRNAASNSVNSGSESGLRAGSAEGGGDPSKLPIKENLAVIVACAGLYFLYKKFKIKGK
jgi:hypothetical protein